MAQKLRYAAAVAGFLTVAAAKACVMPAAYDTSHEAPSAVQNYSAEGDMVRYKLRTMRRSVLE